MNFTIVDNDVLSNVMSLWIQLALVSVHFDLVLPRLTHE